MTRKQGEATLVKPHSHGLLLQLRQRSASRRHELLLAALASALMFVVGGTMSAAQATTPGPALIPAGGQYVPVAPVKVLDTRSGIGGVPVAPLASGASVTFPATGVGNVQAGDATDVYVVINAISPAASGCLDDFDADFADPGICTTSFDAGNNVSDSDLVQVSDAGDITVSNTSSGSVGVAVSVVGYVQMSDAAAAGNTYVSLPTHTIVDTRAGLGAPEAQIPAGGSMTVQVTGAGGVPGDAAGAALYIGAANATSPGYLSAYPAGGTDSGLAVLSYVPGQVVHNLYLGALSASGRLTLVNHATTPVDFLVGVQGFLVSPSASEAGSTYADVPEQRIVDTRSGFGGVPATPVPAGGSITFTATGTDDVPDSGVSSVVETMRAMNAVDSGYLSIYPGNATDPQAPGVNFYAGGNQDNGLTAALVSAVSPDGQQTITNHSSGTVDIVVSIRGYFQSPTQPEQPGDVAASLSGSSATIAWSAPESDGGAAITGYTVTASPGNATVTVGPNAKGFRRLTGVGSSCF